MGKLLWRKYVVKTFQKSPYLVALDSKPMKFREIRVLVVTIEKWWAKYRYRTDLFLTELGHGHIQPNKWTCCYHIWLKVFFKSGPFPASFYLFLSFQYSSIQLIINKYSIKFCRWLESNRGPLESKATALPTEPQPLPERHYLLLSISL